MVPSPSPIKYIACENMKVALCGAGVVGGGVLSIIARLQDSPFVVHKVLVKSLNKERDFPLPDGASYTTDWKECVVGVDMVIELIGGITLAKEIVFAALRNNVHVVTANKALIAAHMEELEDLLKVTTACFGYEASVAGGIPAIRCLQTSIVLSDKITSVAGILNGTTNYMLSKMDAVGCSYNDVLKEAQALGFAEADPTADVEGHDARAKIAILARLALGCRVAEANIPCTGISSITSDDFNYAKKLSSTIKLVGTARLTSNGDAVQVFVTPCVCPLNGIIANVNGATNVVQILSESVGASHLLGAGAGRFPTANSVVADMVAIGKNLISTPFPVPLSGRILHDADYESKFYIRLNVRDQTGIIMTAGKLCHNNGVSIHAVLQHPITDTSNVPFVITTEDCRRGQVEAFAVQCVDQEWCLSKPLIMPIIQRVE